MSSRFVWDDKAVQKMSAMFPEILDKELQEMLPYAKMAVANAVLDALSESIAVAGKFPGIYYNHILKIVKQTPIRVSASGGLFHSMWNWEELGGYDELYQGFHRGAALQDGGHVGMNSAYGGEPLEKDQATRARFWEAIATGTDFISSKKGTSGKREWSVKDLYEKSLKARVEIWGDLAPEWTVLAFGSSSQTPHNGPTRLVTDTDLFIIEALTRLTVAGIEQAQKIVDIGPSAAYKNPYFTLRQAARFKSSFQTRNKGQFGPYG